MATLVINLTPTTESTIGYEVRYAINSPTPSYLYFSTFNTTITIPGLLDNTTYVVSARSICDGNIYSDWSQKVFATCGDNVTSCYMDGYVTFNGYV